MLVWPKFMANKPCENCKNLWTYSPDQSSPYGEISCGKGHLDGVEDPSTLSEPIDCEDYRERNE